MLDMMMMAVLGVTIFRFCHVLLKFVSINPRYDEHMTVPGVRNVS